MTVTAAGTFDPWPVMMWANSNHLTVAAGKEKGTFAVTVGFDAAPGVYWLRANNADGASPLRPFIVGTLPEVAEVEPNDEPAKSQVLETSAVVVNGRLAKNGDVDCFAVPLKKGQTLVAALDAHDTLRSPMDGVLQLLSADGFVLDQNNDFHGLDPQLAFTAPKDGTYIARVFAFPAAPGTSIRFGGGDAYVYRLTLTTGGFADHARPLAVARTDPQNVEVVGWSIPDSARKLAVLLPAAGTDFARVSAGGVANSVRVRVEPHPVLDATAPAFAQRPTPLAPPFSVSGRLGTAGKVDDYRFAGKKGQVLALQVQSRAFGLPLSPVVQVLDAAGKQIARAEPATLGGDTAVSFTPPADGAYTARVADLYAAGGPRFAYLLRVTPAEPDYDLTAAADRFTVPPGKSLDVPVKVVRRNGFAKPVEIIAEGLPAGVTFATNPPAGKADPNTVTVTLTAGKVSASAPFRLVGRVKDAPDLNRTARAALADFDDTTADLWVTVGDSSMAEVPKKKK